MTHTPNTHRDIEAEVRSFKGCKHFSSFINNSTDGSSMVQNIEKVISDYLNLAFYANEKADLSQIPENIETLRMLRGLFYCTAVERGEDVSKMMLETESLNACIVETLF